MVVNEWLEIRKEILAGINNKKRKAQLKDVDFGGTTLVLFCILAVFVLIGLALTSLVANVFGLKQIDVVIYVAGISGGIWSVIIGKALNLIWMSDTLTLKQLLSYFGFSVFLLIMFMIIGLTIITNF